MEKKTLDMTNPELLNEWDYEENSKLGLFPDKVLPKSNKKAWWHCPICKHKWQARIASRTLGNGCPCCSGRIVVPGKNDLETKFPELAKEWDYEKNLDKSPKKVTPGSNYNAWWKCKKGHSWQARVHRRTQGDDCPYCSGRRVLPGVNDLKTKFPEIANEWDYDKNERTPDQVTPGSNYKAWWKCSICKYEWKMSVYTRTKGGEGCPLCHHRALVTGVNDLETLYPEVAAEWDYDKNNGKLPSMYYPATSKKVWWKCKKGHSWKASIGSRTKNSTGCPICFAVNQTSFSEQAIYYFLARDSSSKVENKSHVVVNNKKYEIDIYIPAINVGIEYDGMYWHKERLEADKEKDKALKSVGIRLLRVKEANHNGTDGDNIFVKPLKGGNYKNLNWAIKELEKLIGLKGVEEIDVDKVNITIRNNFRAGNKENNLSVKYPEIAAEWDYEKNEELLPEQYTAGSNVKVWWKCRKCGHEWKAEINDRTNGQGCPFCAGMVLKPGINDLATLFPKLADEWNYEKNGDLKPSGIKANSRTKVWWKCHDCGYEWVASVALRAKGTKCPACAGHVLVTGKNDLASQFPQIAKEWDYERNKKLKPEGIFKSSHTKVWWKCSKCQYEWEATVNSRTSRNQGCPDCAGMVVKPGINDFATLYPDVAKEWDYEKNGDLKPCNYLRQSSKKVWWKCLTCGHEWKTSISHRANGQRCPGCFGKAVVAGVNDLASQYPDIAAEWDYEKNGDKRPDQFRSHSAKLAWWKCSICGHEWQTKIRQRTVGKGSGCPVCAKNKRRKSQGKKAKIL